MRWGGAKLGACSLVVMAAFTGPGGPGGSEGSPGPTQGPEVSGPWAAPAHSCDVPLAWRIDRLDHEFGLGMREAAEAVRRASALWEEAAGRSLFVPESSDGFPIRFVYDERHERVQERARRHRALDDEGARIERDQADLRLLRDRLARERDEHEARFEALQRRLQAHRAEVDHWNAQGGAPPAEVERLRRIEAELDGERREVNAQAESLNRLVNETNERTRRLNREVDEHNHATAAFRDAFPPESVQSGRYRESGRRLGPWVFSMEREISVFQFDDEDHLVLVLAHELGHALGLAHSGEPDAVMFVNAGERRVPEQGVRLHPRDVEELHRACGS